MSHFEETSRTGNGIISTWEYSRKGNGHHEDKLSE